MRSDPPSMRSNPSMSHQELQQQQPARSNTVHSHSVNPAQSAQPTQSVNPSQSNHPSQSGPPSQSGHPSQSGAPSQSGQQTSAVTPAVESASQQEASSQQATSQIKPAPSTFQPECTLSIRPCTQTPFNVVTSGNEATHGLKRQSSTTTASGAADKQRMCPPAVDGFTPQISPFVAQSEHSLHIQRAPQQLPPPTGDAPPQKQYHQGVSSRSGSYTYGSNFSPSAAFPVQSGNGQVTQDHSNANCYAPAYMQSHMSSQGSDGFNSMPHSAPQYQYQSQQQQQVPQGMQSWQGCEEARASPRNPGGGWHWSDGIGQDQMEGMAHSGSNWDSQQAQSSQFSIPSQADWSDQQPWRQQQPDVSGLPPFPTVVAVFAKFVTFPCLSLEWLR